jgi:hypothetical protein
MGERERNAFNGLCAHKRGWESTELAIVWSNGFEICDGKATGIFDVVSRINHSCVPNSRVVWCDAKTSTIEDEEVQDDGLIDGDGKMEVGRMMVYNSFDLMDGEEITIDYGHGVGWLKKWYGFECGCGCCTDGSDCSSSTDVDASDGVASDYVVSDDEGNRTK